MTPDIRFLKKPKSFWASVRTLSQHIGYSKGNKILTPTSEQMAGAFNDLGLDSTKIIFEGKPTILARELEAYFKHRADKLVNDIEPRLMDKVRAKKYFKELFHKYKP